jgi:polysaccharide export outer membrane protein
MERSRTIWRSALIAVCVASAGLVTGLSGGCAGPGNFVWVNDLPAAATAPSSDSDYVIRDGDLVNIKVLTQEPLSTRARVRSDGRIAMPAIGDIEVRGKRPSAVKAEIEPRLKDYVNAANVTVTVEEFQPITVNVLGEVTRPGSYPFDPRATLAQVLATAGGLNDYASRDSIFLVRATPQPMRVRFTWEDVTRGEPRSTTFPLRHGDLVVVE